ncbi:hypothetical protein ACQZV8_16340 [Magnetococcales bacterium HHB-1]
MDLLKLIIALFIFWSFVRFVVAPILTKNRIKKGYKACSPYLLPQLPKQLDRTISVESRLRPYKRYRVNLYRQTCTCVGFRKQRRHYPKNDIHRLCRHLRKELNTSNGMLYFDKLTQCLIKHRIKDKCYQRLTLSGTNMALGYNPKSEYVRVYTRRKAPSDAEKGPFTGIYSKFVFNMTQENWVYGESPPGERAIISAIITLKQHHKKEFQQQQRHQPTSHPQPSITQSLHKGN